MDSPSNPPTDIVNLYLIPYIILLVLYLMVIGGGGSWLYFSARQAQTELVTMHVLNVVRPTIKQLEVEQGKQKNPYELAKLNYKISDLYRMLPHLRQISLRDSQKGAGVRLASNGKLVEVELEPLDVTQVDKPEQQNLPHQLHHSEGQYFHVYFYLTTHDNQPVQVDLAFNRAGLLEDIEKINAYVNS